MSIDAVLASSLPGTPPSSRRTSFEDRHAAGASDIPTPDLTTALVNEPVGDSYSAEILSASAQVCLMRLGSDKGDESFRAALIALAALAAEAPDVPLPNYATPPANDPALAITRAGRTAAGQVKGKGLDPDLYGTRVTEEDNTEIRGVDTSTDDDAAERLLQVQRLRLENKVLEEEVNPISVLLDLGTQPSPVIKLEFGSSDHDHLYSSQSEDEGPPLTTACKRGFNACCHGNDVQHFAHQGNAVFAIERLRESRFGCHDIDVRNGETQCRRCRPGHEAVHARYLEGYTKLGCEGFERETTVPLDDDAEDSPQHGRYGAAEYDSDENPSEMLSTFPKLGKKALERLQAEKSEWRPEPDLFMDTSSDAPVSEPDPLAAPARSSYAPVSLTDVVEPVQLPMYTEDSNTRGSVTPSPAIAPDATAEQTSPLPSRKRPRYTDRRSGHSFPRASDYINLTTTLSSPSPSTRQPRQNNPLTPSPLKRVQNAAAPDPTAPSPARHRMRTRNDGPVSKTRHPGPQGRPGLRRLPHRAQLTNDFVHIGVVRPRTPSQQQPCTAAPPPDAGPSTPRKRGKTAPPLPPPPPLATGCKRKAVEVEEDAPAVSSSRPKRRRGGAGPCQWVVNGEGEFVAEGERREKGSVNWFVGRWATLGGPGKELLDGRSWKGWAGD